MKTLSPFARPLYVMLKPVGAKCNLRCQYCYYLPTADLRHPSSHKGEEGSLMSEDLLERFTKEYIEAQTTPEVLFTWHGGEPTLRPLSFYRKAVALQRRYAQGRQIANCLQTNGTLLDDVWCEFLAENHFLVGLSIDGPQPFHDHYRLTASGQPTWQSVLRAVQLLRKHGVEWNAMATVNRANVSHPLEFYRFFKRIHCTYLQFTPVVWEIGARSKEQGARDYSTGERDKGQGARDYSSGERDKEQGASDYSTDERDKEQGAGNANRQSYSLAPCPSPLTPISTPLAPKSGGIEGGEWGRFLCAVFDEWVQSDVGETYVELFDCTLANWVGVTPGICAYAKECGHAAVMEADGDVYSCDHFVRPDHRLGNIREHTLVEMLYGPQQQRFSQLKHQALPRQCRECDVLFACHGECPRNRFSTDRYGNPGLNYLCEGYRMFYHHAAPYMDFMARELAHQRPPANVMQAIRSGLLPAPPLAGQ